MTEQQLLRDPNVPPEDGVLAAALGSAYAAYAGFTELLAARGITPEWRYYNDGKSWLCKGLHKWKSPRGADKEKTVFWLSVWEGFFKVTFFISEKTREGIQYIPASADVRAAARDTKPMGKLKFFPLIFDVRAEGVFGDLGALIDYQMNIK